MATDYKTLFGKTPPTKLFLTAALPGIISMLMSAAYQLIDGAFVGQILGGDSFAALNLAMPFVIINFALSDLIGVGSSVPIAIRLGEKNEAEARNIFSSSCLLIVASGFLTGAALYFSAPYLMTMMGADGALAALAAEYLRVYALFAPVTTILFAVDNYLRICGKVGYSMMINILLAVACAFFEFLFLFVFRMDIRGAALGACVGMFICVIAAFFPFFLGRLQLKFSRPHISGGVVLSILTNGCPTFLSNIAGRVTSITMNIFLLRYGGSVAVSAYGVLMYADGIVFPMLYGLCDSLQPAVGYNWGAGDLGRVKAIEKRCFIASGTLSVIMAALMLTFPDLFSGIFVRDEDEALIVMAIEALTIFSTAYFVRWISFATQSYMSAVGKALYATIISTFTAFIFPIALIYALSFAGLRGLWFNYPITSLLSAVISVVILIVFYRGLKAGKETPGSDNEDL